MVLQVKLCQVLDTQSYSIAIMTSGVGITAPISWMRNPMLNYHVLNYKAKILGQ